MEGLLVTPQDPLTNLGRGKPSDEGRNFRYKGYAEGFFHSPREPIMGSKDQNENEYSQYNAGHDLHYRPQQFDPKNPRAFGKPAGLQYGSETMPGNQAVAKPIRGSLLMRDQEGEPGFAQTHRDAEEEIRQYKDEMIKKRLQRQDERKQDWEMLKSYDPWGKPGGGAPISKEDNKKQKFTEYELHDKFTTHDPTPRQQEMMQEYGNFNDYFGRPGAGAPMRTRSGNLKGQYKTSPDIRFLNTDKGRQVHEFELRYKKEPGERKEYAHELATQIKQRKLVDQEHKIDELKKDLEMLRHDPYGRPGAGAPNKPIPGTKPDFRRQVVLPNNSWEEFRRVGDKIQDSERRRVRSQPVDSEFEPYDPWGKGAVQPQYDHRGDTKRHHFSTQDGFVYTDPNKLHVTMDPDEGGATIPLEQTRGGGGSPIKGDDGITKTRLPITMKRNERGDISVREENQMPGMNPHRAAPRSRFDDEFQPYDPWSKPGAGAPLKDTRGELITNVYGNFNTVSAIGQSISAVRDKPNLFSESRRDPPPTKVPKEHQRGYLKELQSDGEVYKQQREMNNYNLKYGEGELAEVIKKGQVGNPRRDPHTGMLAKHHLPTSDVTREQAGYHFQKTTNPQSYHTELDLAAAERRRNQEFDKLKSKQEEKHHGQSMNEFWGRPGGGAPKGYGQQKANLENILYSPRKEADYYNKTMPNGEKPPAYIKSTIPSDHRNHFEVDHHKRRQDYDLPKPFATHPEDLL